MVCSVRSKLRDFFGFPADYLKTYPDHIRSLTAADISRASMKYLNPEKMKIMVLGDKKKFSRPLEDLGTVKTVPLESIE